MHKISMYKSTGKEAVPLALVSNRRRIKDQVINDFVVAKTCNRNKTGNNDNNERNGHGLLVKIPNVKFKMQNGKPF